MIFKRLTFTYLLIATVLCGCSGQKYGSSYVTHISQASVLDSDATPAQKAEALTESAEDLMSAQGLPQAAEFLQKALELDPTNVKAGLLNVLIAPIVEEKGAVTRLKNLATKSDDAGTMLKWVQWQIDDAPQAPVYAIFSDTSEKPAFTNEAQVQAETDRIIQRLEDLRVFARDHKDNEIAVKANALLAPGAVQKYANSCQIMTTDANEYDLVCDDPLTKTQVKLNRGDFEELQGMAIYFKFYLTVYNSYDLVGLADESKSATMDRKNVSPQTIAEELLKNPQFGRLRKEARLGEIKDSGLELEQGLRWSIQNQATLCPSGNANPKNRSGMLINDGICYGQYLSSFIYTLDQAFHDQPVSFTNNKGGQYVTHQHVAMAPTEHPLADVRSLGQFKIDNCGQLISTSDPTIDGLFPNNDANDALSAVSNDCEK